MLADAARVKQGLWPEQASQYPPGAISPPARHLAQLELGHEILGGARRDFEFPCDQSRGQDWARDDELHQRGQARVRTPTDQSGVTGRFVQNRTLGATRVGGAANAPSRGLERSYSHCRQAAELRLRVPSRIAF